MLIMSVLTATLETALNSLLFRDRSLKPARQRLQGKTLKLALAELPSPLVFVFGEHHLDVLSQWAAQADCRLETRLSVLLTLRDRQRLSALMRSGELVIEGDIQVAQQFVTLLDLAECDPAEWLAPYTGDIVAEGVSQAAQKALRTLNGLFGRQRRRLSETVTEEWRLAPGRLEAAWLQEEVAMLARSVDALSERLVKLESVS